MDKELIKQLIRSVGVIFLIVVLSCFAFIILLCMLEALLKWELLQLIGLTILFSLIVGVLVVGIVTLEGWT